MNPRPPNHKIAKEPQKSEYECLLYFSMYFMKLAILKPYFLIASLTTVKILNYF